MPSAAHAAGCRQPRARTLKTLDVTALRRHAPSACREARRETCRPRCWRRLCPCLRGAAAQRTARRCGTTLPLPHAPVGSPPCTMKPLMFLRRQVGYHCHAFTPKHNAALATAPVELGAVVVPACAQRKEVLRRARHLLAIHLHLQVTQRRVQCDRLTRTARLSTLAPRSTAPTHAPFARRQPCRPQPAGAQRLPRALSHACRPDEVHRVAVTRLARRKTRRTTRRGGRAACKSNGSVPPAAHRACRLVVRTVCRPARFLHALQRGRGGSVAFAAAHAHEQAV